MSAALPWKVAAASVVGAGHRRGEIPCQDAHEIRVTAQGWLVGAVADGAGSASHSHLGAKAAVAAAVGVIEAESSQDDFVWDAESGHSTLTAATAAALSAVGQRAGEEDLSPRDLACTLILFAAGDWGIAALQIGDGGLVAEQDGELRSVTVPFRGEYANETEFLTSAGAIDDPQFVFRSGSVRRAAGFSDGLLMLVLQSTDWSPHRPFFSPVFALLREREPGWLPSFLASDRIASRSDDDLTLVLAMHEESPS